MIDIQAIQKYLSTWRKLLLFLVIAQKEVHSKLELLE